MSKKTLFTEVTGQQISAKCGIQVSQYPELPQSGHGLYQPKELLGENSQKNFLILEEDFKELKKISNEEFNTGEIWHDDTYGIYYLILGKSSKNHLVLNLGGDTRSAGSLETGVINSRSSAIFCDSVIFRPKS